MKKIMLFALLVSALLLSFERVSKTQTKPEQTLSEQDKNKPKIIALKAGQPDEVIYHAGTARFLVTSADTNRESALVELTEKPGYKTRLHRHIYTDESYYVLEGVLPPKSRTKLMNCQSALT